MIERPVLMDGEAVRAILDGRKTQTRRPITPQPIEGSCWYPSVRKRKAKHYATEAHFIKGMPLDFSPFGVPGDHVYIRERARLVEVEGGHKLVYGSYGLMVRLRYEADGTESDWLDYPSRLESLKLGHCVANGCYKEAARIWGRVKAVRVERVQDISKADALAEGIDMDSDHASLCINIYENRRGYPNDLTFGCPVLSVFKKRWDSIYAKRGFGWPVNPWVFVGEFELIDRRQEAV